MGAFLTITAAGGGVFIIVGLMLVLVGIEGDRLALWRHGVASFLLGMSLWLMLVTTVTLRKTLREEAAIRHTIEDIQKEAPKTPASEIPL